MMGCFLPSVHRFSFHNIKSLSDTGIIWIWAAGACFSFQDFESIIFRHTHNLSRITQRSPSLHCRNIQRAGRRTASVSDWAVTEAILFHSEIAREVQAQSFGWLKSIRCLGIDRILENRTEKREDWIGIVIWLFSVLQFLLELVQKCL